MTSGESTVLSYEHGERQLVYAAHPLSPSGELDLRLGDLIFTPERSLLPAPDVSLHQLMVSEALARNVDRYGVSTPQGKAATIASLLFKREKVAPVEFDEEYGCWMLPLAAEYDSKNRARYPNLYLGRLGIKGTILAHRATYTYFLGADIPDIQHGSGNISTAPVDHLCHRHACCNPYHLQVVTPAENTKRGRTIRHAKSQPHLNQQAERGVLRLPYPDMVDYLHGSDFNQLGFEKKTASGLFLPPGLGLAGESQGSMAVGTHKQFVARHKAFNLLSQTRQTIDPEGLQELASSLIDYDENGRPSINLIQPVTAGVFTKKEAQAYLDNLNSTWSSDHRVEDLEATDESRTHYLILFAGHRRMQAIKLAAEEIGLDIDALDIVFNAELGHSIKFSDAIRTQYRENFHKKPEPWEDAYAIIAIYRHGYINGRYASYADCARDLGVSEERVSKANRFYTLPESIRSLVIEGNLSFTRALILTQVHSLEVFKLRVTDLSDEDRKVMFNKIKLNRALTSEMDRLTDKESVYVEEVMLHHAIKACSFKKDQELKRYVESILENYINGGQLSMLLIDEAQLRRSELARLRRITNQVGLEALKSMGAVLSPNGSSQNLFTGNPKTRKAVKVILEKIIALDEKSGITVGREVSAELFSLAEQLELA